MFGKGKPIGHGRKDGLGKVDDRNGRKVDDRKTEKCPTCNHYVEAGALFIHQQKHRGGK